MPSRTESDAPVDSASSTFRQATRSALAVGVPITAGIGLSFAVSVALARWLGAAEFGTYTYAMSWVAILGTVSVLGLDTTLVRQLPAYAATSTWGLLAGLLRWANRVTIAVSAGIAAFALLARALFAGGVASLASPVWLCAGALIPLVALARIQQSSLRGLNRAAASQVPESVLIPLLMLGFIAVAGRTDGPPPLAAHALAAQAVGTCLALATARALVLRAVPRETTSAAAQYRPREWLKTSSRMLLLTGLSTINGRIGILMLGALAAPQVVGPYAAALRGAGFISLALNISVLAHAPSVAHAYAAGETQRLQALMRRMSQIAMAGGIPIAVVLVLWGRSLLLVFGPGFQVAGTALMILALGELVNIAAGPVATLLVMTGHEREAVLGLAAGTALNALLCLILIPAWGLEGAAVAAAASVAVWNVLLWEYVRRRLSITSLGGHPGAQPPIA